LVYLHYKYKDMITVNNVNESITGSYVIVEEGKPVTKAYGVKFTEEAYAAMSDIAIKSESVESMEDYNKLVEEFIPYTIEDYKKTVETVCPYILYNENTKQYFLKQGELVSKVPMPKSFVDRILLSFEKGIDVMPLIHFWTRLLRNPYFSITKAELVCGYIANTFVDEELFKELMLKQGLSSDVARERATSLQTPITQEGLLCTYKVSREILHRYELDEEGNKVKVDRYAPTKTIDDITGEVTVQDNLPSVVEDRIFEPAVVGQGYDAFYCGAVLGHVIKVGEVHKLENWSQVDCRDYHSCVKGLHVGNLDYIKGYQCAGRETHNVFVDPMHIGAVTNDGSAALRVKQYFVHSSFAGVNKTVYHSSTYAAMTDAEWEDMRADAIKKNNERLAQMSEEIEGVTEALNAL
jgi:hypothetical protein